jgi:glycosyltransferase involved in cell wall biosynthesis
LNKVQAVNNNRAGSNPGWDAPALRQRFSKGQRVDVDAYAGFIPNACHQEVDLKTRLLESAQPLVSVIIPCFNQAQYLTEAVESVLGQRHSDWEIIIINDGSQDNTSEVAQALANNHPGHRIRLLEQANAGLAAARNAGIRACSGQYVLPLDADDKIAPAMLETTVSCLQADPGLAIVYTDAWYFGAVNHSQATIDYDFNYLCHQNHLQYCSLYRREVWERVGGYSTNMTWGYEDWDFWISCGEAGFQAKHIGEPLFHYRVKAESMFTRALKHDLELRAQIVLNHPRLYNEPTRQWARSVLGEPGAAGAEAGPTAPHEILCRGEVLAELRRRNADLESELQALKDWRSKELALKDAPLKTRELRRILKAYAKRKLNRLKPFPVRAT